METPHHPRTVQQLKAVSSLLYILVLIVQLSLLSVVRSEASLAAEHDQVYVVYMGHHGDVHRDVILSKHYELLSSVKGSLEETSTSMLYSYKHSFSGFSAKLTAQEACALSKMPEVISVFPSQQRKLHTTRSWEFLGVEDTPPLQTTARKESGVKATLWERANYGNNTVIGLLDTGVWPESQSFRDHGMDPVPPTWKGACESGDSFNESNCNRKLIGARMYIKAYEHRFGPLNVTATGEFRSPRDKDGHGTHTSSTAAGRVVPRAAALGGFGAGTASGGASLARLAVYKVCWPLPGGSPAGDNTCSDADMLAALDDAVADGVNVISMSIGYSNPQPKFFEDSIAIGALHALQHNVLVSCSGGNAGPKPATISNVAPWLLTVAASSVDRTFLGPLILGNGQTVEGQTVTPYSLKPKFYPLIHAANALLPNTSISPTSLEASQCMPGSLDSAKVKGKIVFCLRGVNARVAKGEEVLRAGGAGMILANLPSNGVEISVDAHLLPATAVPAHTTTQIVQYLKTTKNPMAKLIPAKTDLGVKPSPFIAAFSSQGPNSLTPGILKPDISAPGLNILAAWAGDNGPTKLAFDHRRVKYNIISGTSMSCPHVSGTAALLKSIHPSWSVAAIKSALMTTGTRAAVDAVLAASVTDSDGKMIRAASGDLASPFLMGAGEMNPTMAADPGLVYDIELQDYCGFLCAVGYNDSLISRIVPSLEFTCGRHSGKASDLNLPSLVVDMSAVKVVEVARKVKNVGGTSVYTVSIKPPTGTKVRVEPSKLAFTRTGQSQAFKVKISLQEKERVPISSQYAFGSFTWSDGLGHTVRSPLVVQV